MWKDWLKRLTRKAPTPAIEIVIPPVPPLPPPVEPVLEPERRGWRVLCNSWSGHDREAGLKLLRASPSTGALGAILDRLNDWVPQVRQAANEALADYLNPEHADALIAQMPKFLALVERKRADHLPTLKRLEAVLAMEACRARCDEAYWLSRGASARFYFNVLVQTDHAVEQADFLARTMRHPDLAARQMAVAKTLELPDGPAQTVLMLGLENASGVLRTRAFHASLRFEDGRAALIRRCLMDPSPAVRSLALWAAKKYDVDVAKVLHERLAADIPGSKAQWLGALGLAMSLEVRMPAHWVGVGLSHGSGFVRAQTLALEGPHQPDLLLGALDDPSRTVFDVVIRGVDQMSWQAISAVISPKLELEWHTLPPTRRQGIHRVMPKWEQVRFLLDQLQKNTDWDYWLDQLQQWVALQYRVVDWATPKTERLAIIERLRDLEGVGALQAGSVSRIA